MRTKPSLKNEVMHKSQPSKRVLLPLLKANPPKKRSHIVGSVALLLITSCYTDLLLLTTWVVTTLSC